MIRQLTLILAILCTPAFGMQTNESSEEAYRQGTELLKPYFVLTDRNAADPKTAKGIADIKEGIRLLTIAVKANPENWPALWQIGKAYQATGNHPSAYAALRQASKVNPHQQDVAREYMIECICVGKTSEAVLAAEAAVAASPNDTGLAANLGLALLADGQLSRAQGVTERAIAADPSDPMTQGLLSEILDVEKGRKPSQYCPQ